MSSYLPVARKIGYNDHNSVISEIIDILNDTRNEIRTTRNDGIVDSESEVQLDSFIQMLEFMNLCFNQTILKDSMTQFYVPVEPDNDKNFLFMLFKSRGFEIKDYSFFDNNAKLVGFPKIRPYINQKYPKSVRFPDSGDLLLTIPTATVSEFQGMTGFTISFMLYPDTVGVDTGANKLICNCGAYPSTVANSFKLYFDNDNDLVLEIKSNTSGTVTLTEPFFKTSDLEKWYNIIIEYDGSNINLYIDNVLKQTSALTGVFNLFEEIVFSNSTIPIKNCNIKNIAIYNTYLNSEKRDYLLNLNGSYALAYENLLSFYSFDETVDPFYGNLILDEVGINNIITNKDYSVLVSEILDDNVPETYDDYKPLLIHHDGISNFLLGYYTQGNESLYIQNDIQSFDLSNKAIGKLVFYLPFVFTNFEKHNDFRQTLFCFTESENGNYSYSVEIGDDQKLYFSCKFNGTLKIYKSSIQLTPSKLYKLIYDIDIVNQILTAYIDGIPISLTSIDSSFSQLPTSNDVADSNEFRIGISFWNKGQIQQGNMIFKIYGYYDYNDEYSVDNYKFLCVNERSISRIRKGNVLTVNGSILRMTSPYIITLVEDSSSMLSQNDVWIPSISDTIKTGRFTETMEMNLTNENNLFHNYIIGVPSEFCLYLSGTGKEYIYSKKDFRIVDYEFTVSFWAKFEGTANGDSWGCAISQIDGYKDLNRVLLNGTQIKVEFLIGDHDSKITEIIVNTPDTYTNNWRHFLIAYDGKRKDQLVVMYQGQVLATSKKRGKVEGGNNPIIIGKGGQKNKYFFKGKIDDVVYFRKALKTSEAITLFATDSVPTTNLLFHLKFNKTLKDDTDKDNDFKSNMVVTYSSDVRSV